MVDGGRVRNLSYMSLLTMLFTAILTVWGTQTLRHRHRCWAGKLDSTIVPC